LCAEASISTLGCTNLITQTVTNHFPHYKEKGAFRTGYCKPPKNKENINGDQEGCMLDLKPAPDESW
jgi:hypothetical protein